MKQKKFTKLLSKTFPCFISAAGLFWILRQIQWDKLWTVLKALDALFYGAGLVVVGGGLLIQTYRWSLCLARKSNISLFRLLRLTTISYFFNNFFLAFWGGDAYRAISLSGEQGVFRSAFSVLLARSTNIWGAAVIPAPLVLFAWSYFSQNTAFLIVFAFSAVTWLASLAFLILLHYRQNLRLSGLWERFPKTAAFLKDFALDEGRFMRLFGSSLAFHLLGILVHYCYARALHIDISLSQLTLIVPCVLILTSLPISINGVGVRESSFVFALGFFHVSREQALALSIASYSGHLILSLAGGLMLASYRKRSRRKC